MSAAGLVQDLNSTAKFLVAFLHDESVLLSEHPFVRIADNEKKRDLTRAALSTRGLPKSNFL